MRRTHRITHPFTRRAAYGTLAAATLLVAAATTGTGSADAASHGAASHAAALKRAAASCPSGDVCFWPQPNFGGQVEVWHNPWARTCDWVKARPARSLFNHDNDTWSFYRDANCRSHAITLGPGQSNGHVNVQTWQ
ncbi:peptidase inhibitor family I36 protein [Streptomyces sp. NPDC003077]|uniref:peptidase inhibitor family I36 protein n=1 Tax=Streptomyces sp. NPDC003077 TaxID=3154443 RepID=UPI0033AE31FE